MSGSSEGRSRPRWDSDDRGVGVGDARAHIAIVDAMRDVADRDGWADETSSLIHERRDEDDTAIFDVVTGLLPEDTAFATHAHTLRLRVRVDG